MYTQVRMAKHKVRMTTLLVTLVCYMYCMPYHKVLA